MKATDRRRGRASVAIALLGALVVACSPAASVAPTALATAVATPSPVASASTAAVADPAIGLKIAAPYNLTSLDAAQEAALRQQASVLAGGFASLIGFGGRQVTMNDAPVGAVFVIGLPAGTMSDATYQVIINGLASNSGVAFKTTTIAGTEVASGAGPSGVLAFFRHGDNIIMVVMPQTQDLDTVAKALIDANK